MKHLPSFRILMGAMVALVSTAAGAAGTPQQRCQATKNGLAGRYASCLQGAERKLVASGEQADYDAAVLGCQASFEEKWLKETNRALLDGSPCLDEPLDSADFAAVIEEHAASIAAALAGDPLLPGPVTCSSNAQACEGDLATCQVDLDACLAGPDPVCNPGFFNCDGLAGNGCEVDARSDADNCGACGTVCSAGQACSASTCQAVACTTTAECPADSFCSTNTSLCSPCSPGTADSLQTGGSFTTLSSTVPNASFFGGLAYDPDKKRVWLVGGSSTPTIVQYYDTLSELAYVSSGTTGSVVGAGSSTSAFYDSTNKKIWHIAGSQICSFDTDSSIGSCPPQWTFPTDGSSAAMTGDGNGNLYLVLANLYTYRFDTSLALQNLNPWTALPDRNMTPSAPLAAAFLDGWLYAFGTTTEPRTAVERLHVSAGATAWEPAGVLARLSTWSSYVQAGQIVYVISGFQNSSYTNRVMAYDLLSGQSADVMGLEMGTGRAYAVAAFAPEYGDVYVMNGYAHAPASGVTNTIERLRLPYDANHDNDGDGRSDLFDTDDDNDGILDPSDSCRLGY